MASAWTHPFQRFPRRRRRAALIALVALSLLPGVLSAALTPLHEDEPGGQSIVDFELAGSVERTREILTVWRAEGVVDDAKAIQILDLLYPLIYAAALAGGCVAASGPWRRAGWARLADAGIALAWLAFVAAGFDYVENVGLGVSLWGEPTSPWPQVAYAAAVLKFAGIALALLYALSGVVASVSVRARPPTAGDRPPA